MKASSVLAAALACALVAAPAAVGGAFDPNWWGWLAFAPLLVAAIAFAARRASFCRAEYQLVGGLALFLAWTALSILWSQSVPRSVAEVERGLVYVAAALALVVVRRSAAALVTGLLVATFGIAAEALGSRFLNDGTGRLDGPLIYWNALGILCTAGLLLSLGIAAGHGRLALRAAAAAGGVVLSTTLYLTYSRGALAAAAAGVALLFAFQPRRLRLACVSLAVAPAYAAAAALAAHAPREAAAAAVALLMPTASGAALLGGRVETRLGRTGLGRAATAGIVSTFVVVLLAGLLGAAGPVHAARPTSTSADGSDRRLLTVSDQGRIEYWRVAWHEYTSSPLHGTGAGTFELSWHRNRSTFYDVRDAHSLYLETLAETGPLGLTLLVAALAAPFFGAGSTRRHALGPALLATYGAILLHAAVDWDWEMPAVMTAAFGCGIAAIAARNAPRRRARRGAATVASAALVVLAVAGMGVQLANASQSQAYAALHRSQFAAAERDARRARRFEPWASEPLRILGEAQLALHHTPLARTRFRQALRKDPNEWRLWYDLATASTGRGQKAALTHALRLNPLEPILLAFADQLRSRPIPLTIRG